MSEERQLLTDIHLVLRQAAFRPVYGVEIEQHRVTTRNGSVTQTDFAIVSGKDNLGQAIMMRLLTPLGELDSLAHPEYGSRLHELIGQPNTETTLNLVRLYILESLRHERRIEKVIELKVIPSPGTRDRVDVQLKVKPIGQGPALDLGPFALEL